MNMKFEIIILSSVMFISFVSFAQKKKVKSAIWQPEQVIIDGDMSEWSNPLMFVDKETKLAYSINNDESNIYLCFKAVDEITKMKLLKVGMTISIDTTGKKKQSISINYPLKGEGIERQTETPNLIGVKPDMEEIKRKFKQKPQNMVLGGFKSGNGLSMLQNENGVVVKLGWDKNNDIFYEMAIPFKSFWKGSLSEINTSKYITLNVILDALEKPNFGGKVRPSGSGRPSGAGGGTGRPSGSGGRPGGGRPSFAGGGNSEEFNKLFSEQKLTAKFLLTKSK